MISLAAPDSLAGAAVPGSMGAHCAAGGAHGPRELCAADRAAPATVKRIERSTTAIGAARPQFADRRRHMTRRAGDVRASRTGVRRPSLLIAHRMSVQLANALAQLQAEPNKSLESAVSGSVLGPALMEMDMLLSPISTRTYDHSIEQSSALSTAPALGITAGTRWRFVVPVSTM